MKKLIIAAVLMIGMTSFAQEKPAGEKNHKREQLTPEQRNEKHLKKLTSDLSLSASQQSEIEKILAEQSSKKEDKRALTQQEIDLMRNQRKNEMKAQEAKIKAVLTPEQLKKYDDLKTEKRQEMTEKHQEKKEAKEKK